MEMILERSQVKKEDKWDVDSIYPELSLWEQDAKTAGKLIEKLADMKTMFLNSASNFKDMVLLDDKTSRLIEKLYVFAHLKSNEDMRNATYQELIGKASQLYQDYEEKTAYVQPMMLKEEPSKILGFIDQEKELETYRHNIEDLLRYKDHTLTEEQEKILAAFSRTLSAGSDAASFLMDADMRFGNIINENGEEVELTDSNYSIYLKSFDRKVRKQAFERMQETYGSYKNTLTATLASVVNAASVSARLNHFSSSLQASLYANKIPEALYTNLIESVHRYLPLLYDYFAIKKDLLQVDEFHLYDGYVSTVPSIDKQYDFETGKQLVQEALSILGDEYSQVLKSAFVEGWIDKYPNRGKSGGAYSSGCYDTKPYVLLNYTNTYDDVSTLAHELGHSMHSYFSIQYNDYANHSYPLFLAEIASTVNELLFSYYMEQQATDPKEKMAILNERLDMFKGTIFRQTMFAEFEKHMHDLTDQKEILTADSLSKYYYELNKLYFGKDVVVDEAISYEWLRIPHFYRPFYVYQYATGLSIAAYIAKNILEETPGFKDKYIEFLKSGGRDYPLEVLKIIDVDLTTAKVFDEAMDMFRDTLGTFKKLNQK